MSPLGSFGSPGHWPRWPESHETIVSLIANTTTERGLKIRARLDRRSYPKGIVVTDEQLATLRIKRATFHGDWNYAILPRQ